MLGFGRALGETMAVTMVIGNSPRAEWSLFAPQYTMAAVIANEFTEAADELHLHALVEIGLVLFVITLIINALSRVLIWRMTREGKARSRPTTDRREACRMNVPGHPPPLDVHAHGRACAPAAVLLALIPVVLIVAFVVKQGVRSLDWAFFTQMPKPVGETGGGMANAMVGTLILCGIAASIAVPVGILSGDLHRRIRRQPAGVSRPLRGRHAQRRALDRHRRVRLRGRRAALQAVLGARRRNRARHHDDPDHRAHDRGTAATRADVTSRGRAGARSDARPGRVHRRAAGGCCPASSPASSSRWRESPARRRRCSSRRSATASGRPT